MITLEQPSVALNDERLLYTQSIQMWETRTVRETETRDNIINMVVALARRAEGGKLKNVVFNCHGNTGYLFMGEGFSRRNVRVFHRWAGLVEKIWLIACEVAGMGDSANTNGSMFCAEIAIQAECYVVASRDTQLGEFNRARIRLPTGTQEVIIPSLPLGQIHSFEGLVRSWNSHGIVDWKHQYPLFHENEISM